MIIKGKSRSRPIDLAKHLGNAEKNERITVLETRGTVSDDLRGALVEMDAFAIGTRCQMPLYHAAISPGLPHRLTAEQRSEAINALEEKLGFTGHARAVMMHEKLGRQHIHVVWSRINLDKMRSVSDSHNYRKHEEVARELERRFGHERVQGAHHERDGVKRPDRTPSRAELRQEERTGISGRDVRKEVTEMFRSSDGPEAFRAALEEKEYILAQGDRRDFVIVDRAGGIHSLARRIDDIKAAELREFMSPLDRSALPTTGEAKEMAAERARRAEEPRLSHEEAQIEKSFGRGDDYVTQSTAAQKDFERRQDILNREADAIRLFDDIGRPENERRIKDDEERQQTDRSRQNDAQFQSGQQARNANTDADWQDSQHEISDQRQRLMDTRKDHDGDAQHTDEWDPDRQREAPGGGRTRSR